MITMMLMAMVAVAIAMTVAVMKKKDVQSKPFGPTVLPASSKSKSKCKANHLADGAYGLTKLLRPLEASSRLPEGSTYSDQARSPRAIGSTLNC